ncbi:hypothetical protein PgNI_05349 [Pyricularia grisea]|uniref:Uncharacterized protein n=1 Tax=Pyricularia grisea TaxID=148305 RepID=A0A6P8B7N3_PYRGI|nr:hypothetical protein PgNI_05349 [Pyricularia grisea]TLD11332.1 hypothetical protein PgNI_05349 [Pyricularia grisea]
MRFPIASLAIIATAQLGLTASASGAVDTTLHHLEARETFQECFLSCKERFRQKHIKKSEDTKFTANEESSCYEECKHKSGAPSSLMDFANHYDKNGRYTEEWNRPLIF